MRWVLIVLPTVLLSAWTATGATEGTWVVWKRTIGPDSEEWSRHEAYLNKPQCQGFGITMALTQDVRSARAHPDYRDFERGEDGTSYTFTKLKSEGTGSEPVYVGFVCLPDTIDPREKK